MPSSRLEKLRVTVPSSNRVEPFVFTVTPDTLKVPAGVVGGSDSTRPSTSTSPVADRRSDSSVADVPVRFTTSSIAGVP